MLYTLYTQVRIYVIHISVVHIAVADSGGNLKKIKMRKIFPVILSVFLQATLLFAQKQDDINILRDTDFARQYSTRRVTYGFSENPSKLSLCNPLYHLLSGSMYVYQKYVSPQLSTNCPYSPSCSAYSKQLIREYGMLKGVFCSADRLMRCNRIVLSSLPHSAFDEHDHKVHESTERYLRIKN